MTDPAAFEAFMRSYQNMVFTSAFRLLNNHAESQDIAQEVFIKAYNHFEELSQSNTAGGWLKTVTRNLCLNHLTRYRRRWRLFSDLRRKTDQGDETDFEANLPAADTRSDDERRDEQRSVLSAALQSLPDSQRIALVLYHFEEMPYQEIADHLKCSLSKIKTDIARGREALRHKINPDALN